MKKIFISYSDTDRNKMRAIERLINATDFLKPIIIADNRQILLHLTDKVTTGIFECDYFVPLITKNSIYTQWLNQEIGFATALKREIIPIVEKQVLDLLKGFVHKQLDLSYLFEGNDKSAHSESSRFTSAARILINDILISNDKQPNIISIENLFPGRWKCIFNSSKLNGADENVEIKDKNKYYVNGRHFFNLERISIDMKRKKFSYLKAGLLEDKRRIVGEMKIMELGKMYAGFEDGNIQVSYYRID